MDTFLSARRNHTAESYNNMGHDRSLHVFAVLGGLSFIPHYFCQPNNATERNLALETGSLSPSVGAILKLHRPFILLATCKHNLFLLIIFTNFPTQFNNMANKEPLFFTKLNWIIQIFICKQCFFLLNHYSCTINYFPKHSLLY